MDSKTPNSRPRNGDRVALYVPVDPARTNIAPGSAIVGYPHDGAVMVYFEGNLFGAQNLQRYEERVQQAYGRMVAQYPTVARALMAEKDLLQVGWTTGSETEVREREGLDHWLRTSRPIPPHP